MMVEFTASRSATDTLLSTGTRYDGPYRASSSVGYVCYNARQCLLDFGCRHVPHRLSSLLTASCRAAADKACGAGLREMTRNVARYRRPKPLRFLGDLSKVGPGFCFIIIIVIVNVVVNCLLSIVESHSSSSPPYIQYAIGKKGSSMRRKITAAATAIAILIEIVPAAYIGH
jgi:hypothetical protein